MTILIGKKQQHINRCHRLVDILLLLLQYIIVVIKKQKSQQYMYFIEMK